MNIPCFRRSRMTNRNGYSRMRRCRTRLFWVEMNCCARIRHIVRRMRCFSGKSSCSSAMARCGRNRPAPRKCSCSAADARSCHKGYAVQRFVRIVRCSDKIARKKNRSVPRRKVRRRNPTRFVVGSRGSVRCRDNRNIDRCPYWFLLCVTECKKRSTGS